MYLRPELHISRKPAHFLISNPLSEVDFRVSSLNIVDFEAERGVICIEQVEELLGSDGQDDFERLEGIGDGVGRDDKGFFLLFLGDTLFFVTPT